MIWILALVAILGMAFWSIDFVRATNTEGARRDVAVVARELTLYHTAAARACTATCPPGLVDQSKVVEALPSFRKTPAGTVGRGSFDGTRFRSASIQTPQGSMLVTFLRDTDPALFDRRGEIRAALADEVPAETGKWTATRTADTIATDGERLWRFGLVGGTTSGRPAGSTAVVQVGTTITIPGALAGQIPVGTPILVSRM